MFTLTDVFPDVRLPFVFAPQQARAEQEEEFISNTLFKKIQALQKEKETLAVNYEKEEEFLTNELSRKLMQVSDESKMGKHPFLAHWCELFIPDPVENIGLNFHSFLMTYHVDNRDHCESGVFI